MEFFERLEHLLYHLEDFLEQAPCEEDCTDEENDMYADMDNLIQSICDFFESEGYENE